MSDEAQHQSEAQPKGNQPEDGLQLSLPIEETPATHPHLFIEVRTPESRIITEGNDAGFEVLTGRILTSYRRRKPEDPQDAEFVMEAAKSRLQHSPTSEPIESYRSFVNSVVNHTQQAVDARKWVGAGAHSDPALSSRRSPTDHGTRTYPLYDGEGESWI